MAEKKNVSARVCQTWRVLAVLAVLCIAAFAQPTSTDPAIDNGSLVCPENQFFDHGTSSCEDCTDICKNAEYKKTVDDCQRLCPAIYNAMQDGQKKPVVDISGAQTNPKPSVDSSSHLGPAVGGGIAGFLVFAAAIVGVVAWKLNTKKTTQQSVVYSPAVQEEEGEQAAKERLSYVGRLRRWLNKGVFAAHGEESEAGQEGPQEIAVLGSSHDSHGSALGTSNSHRHHHLNDMAKVHKNSPIYKPSVGQASAAAAASQPRNPIYKPSAALRNSQRSPPVVGRSPARHSGPFVGTPTLI